MSVSNTMARTIWKNYKRLRSGLVATFTQPEFKAVVDAIDDRMVGQGRTAIHNDIEAAAPGEFPTAGEKDDLFRAWARER